MEYLRQPMAKPLDRPPQGADGCMDDGGRSPFGGAQRLAAADYRAPGQPSEGVFKGHFRCPAGAGSLCLRGGNRPGRQAQPAGQDPGCPGGQPGSPDSLPAVGDSPGSHGAAVRCAGRNGLGLRNLHPAVPAAHQPVRRGHHPPGAGWGDGRPGVCHAVPAKPPSDSLRGIRRQPAGVYRQHRHLVRPGM